MGRRAPVVGTMVELSVALIISISMGLTLGPFCTRMICKPLDVYEDEVAAPARKKGKSAAAAAKLRQNHILSRSVRAHKASLAHMEGANDRDMIWE